MAGTARRNADGPGDGPAGGRPDPGIREALMLEVAVCRKAVEDLVRDPGSGPALEMVARVLSVLEILGERAFGERVDEAVIEAMCARAVAADRARPRPLRAV